MKKILTTVLVVSMANVIAQTIPTAEDQIKVAVLAAPAEMRAGAMVYGYDSKGTLTVLRKGSNQMICLGDDPKIDGISVASYHIDAEPFMARGRALKAEGKTFQEIFETREAEVKAGKLSMPKNPSTLYIYTADEWEAATGTVKNGYLRYVIYIPYATSETTGLPLKPTAAGEPWLMDAGTHRAHIMISPAKSK